MPHADDRTQRQHVRADARIRTADALVRGVTSGLGAEKSLVKGFDIPRGIDWPPADPDP
ncbi:hypothetical protein ACIBFB_24070 [Nocardiopsis sp. NPDC050513]|uniref:hypothetical protein n=1 Tax=Nocardiopsis sp. NPDC050513 TaxID=3364338 RepID=UPI0037AA2FA7